MRSSRKKLPAALCLIFFWMSLSHLSAQNKEVLAEYKLAYIGQTDQNPSYLAAYNGAVKAAFELSKSYSIDAFILNYTPAEELGQSQLTALAHAFADDVDGIVIAPDPTETLTPALEYAREVGIEIIFIESSTPDFTPLASIEADEAEAGRLAATLIIEEIPNDARVAILTSRSPTPRMLARLNAARNTLGFRRIEAIIETEPNYESANLAIQTAIKNDKNDLISGWIFISDWPCQGYPSFPWKAGVKPVVAIQSAPASLLFMQQNYLQKLIVFPYYDWGYKSTEILIQSLFKQVPPSVKKAISAPSIINQTRLSDSIQEWKLWLL